MLEVLMTKNENNSHAFLRKMAENIKQTKDAQCPEDAKANEVRSTFGVLLSNFVTVAPLTSVLDHMPRCRLKS